VTPTKPITPNKTAKGDGTAPYKRAADGMWCMSVDLPRRDDGKRRRKVVVAKTEGAVKLKMKEVQRQLLRDGDVVTANQTLESWLNIWFRDIALKKVRPKTAATYRTMLNQYIIPSIGKVRLDKLTPDHVRKLERFITEPQGERKGLSSTTANQAHRILAVALKYAEREGRVTKNVAVLTDAPPKAVNDLKVLSGADGVKVLLHAAQGQRLGSRWAAALLTGARQGEVIGLEIDRVTDRLDLSWQLQRLSWEHGCKPTGKFTTNRKAIYECGKSRGTDCPTRKVTHPANWEHRYLTGGYWLSRPKSSAGWRIIPLVSPMHEILERRLEIAAGEPNPFGLVWTADPKIHAGRADNVLPLDGMPIDPAQDSRAWHDILAEAGVGDVRLHDARHTSASLLGKANVPEADIMKILGHNSYAVTRGYQNIDYEQMSRAMSALSGQLQLDA